MADNNSQPIMPPPPAPTIANVLGTYELVPTSNLFNINGVVDVSEVDSILRLELETLGAIDLATIVSSDSISGDNVRYSIFAEMAEFNDRYNPTNLLTNAKKNYSFDQYQINLLSRIPSNKYIQQNELTKTYSYLDENNVLITRQYGYIYFDTNGDLVIQLDNMNYNEIVEIQIDTNGTIYKVK